MKTSLASPPSWASAALLGGLLLAPLYAQRTAPAAPATDATVELPPFEVRTEKDEGYMAQNTASGSRLNTSLKDTPAPISVFTPEFLADIAATDLASLSEYVINTERIPGFQGGLAAGNNLGEFDAQFRVRGLPSSNNEGRSINFFKYLIEVDAFNTERVEFARGPNSILFGLGSVAGNFNVTTKKANLQRPRYELTLRTDSNDALRTAVDLNQPLVKDKVALRVNALKDNPNSWRPHEYKDAERLALAGRWQIARRTSLDVEYERGTVTQSNQRQWVGADYFSDWIARGRQIDPTPGGTFPQNASLTLFNTNYVVFTSNTGTIHDWRTLTASGPTSRTGAPFVPPTEILLIQNFALVPKDVVIGGPGVGSDVDYHTYSAFLRHEVAKNFFVEVATNAQKDSYLTRDIFAPQYRLQYDTNAQLPDGTPNPNVGRPYLEGQFGTRERYEWVRDHRGTASYELDLGPKFGRHQLAGLLERRYEHTQRTGTGERLLGAPSDPGNPESFANNFYRRTYVDLAGPSSAIALADFRAFPVSGLINRTTGQPVTTIISANNQNAVYDYSFKFTTYMVATQSRFWRDRIVATLGYREDYSDAQLSTAARGAPVGGYRLGFYQAVPGTTPSKSKGITRSQGVVFHATKWASLFYNHSSNFALRNPQITVFTDRIAPPPKGKSDDLGLKATALNGRLYATLTYYQTRSVDENDFVAPGGVSQLNDIWRALAGAGVITNAERDTRLVNANGNAFDSRSQGWELELVANPTSNWRLMLNFSDNKTERTRIGDEVVGYVAANRDFFTQGTRSRLVINGNGTLAANAIDPGDGVTTIAESLASVDTAIQTTIYDPLGARAIGTPTQSANLRTNYSFAREGRLNGFSLGGGARWRGKPVIGYTSSNPATRRLLWGDTSLILDANIGYRRKLAWFSRSFEWQLQLNVSNVLDNDDIFITGAYSDGMPKQYRLQAPRQWIVTSTFRF